MPGMTRGLIGVLWVLLAAGCGTAGKEIATARVQVQPVGRSIAVLPVSDYSYIQDVGVAHRQQNAVQRNLAEALAARGFGLAPQPEIFRALIRSGHILEMSYEDIKAAGKTSSLQNLLNEEWSDMMKSEIVQLVKRETRRNIPGLAVQDTHLDLPPTAVLDQDALIHLGREFGVDFILRGRLIEYDLRQEYKVEPLRREFLPFLQGGEVLHRFGVAGADQYDIEDNLVVGGALTEMGKEGEHGIRLQLWAHDAATGLVVWTGRTDTPVSAGHFETAVSMAADELLDRFSAVVAVDSDGDGVWDYRDLCPGTSAGTAVDSFGCERKSAPAPETGQFDECPAGMRKDEKGCRPAAGEIREVAFTEPTALDLDDKDWPWLFAQKEELSIELRIQFDFDQAIIKPVYHEDLAKVANFLRNHSETKMTIEGHTDNVGSDRYNLGLSLRRAESVKTYLVERFGIAPSRLKAIGHGKSLPIASNDTSQGRVQNRRSVAVITAIK